jgi:hypothetical protein
MTLGMGYTNIRASLVSRSLLTTPVLGEERVINLTDWPIVVVVEVLDQIFYAH